MNAFVIAQSGAQNGAGCYATFVSHWVIVEMVRPCRRLLARFKILSHSFVDMQHGRWDVSGETRQNRLYKRHWCLKKTRKCKKKYNAHWRIFMCRDSIYLFTIMIRPKHKETQFLASLTEEHNYLNFAETTSEKPRRSACTHLHTLTPALNRRESHGEGWDE